jgi:Uma2 family endonuclease
MAVAGTIREVWIVDLEHDRLLAYRDPAGDGYQVVQTLRGGEALSRLAFPDRAVAVDHILPCRPEDLRDA